MEALKRVLAIHDISCFGKCSLTVALPILSACGVEVTALPTAVLSTHTGGFTGFTYRDLTQDIMPIVNHWKTLDIGFEAMYSGFLGSFEQIDMVKEIFDTFRKDGGITLVDPVMADNGNLYSIYTMEMAKGMAGLCAKADIVVPNITEACFMLDKPYKEEYTQEYIEDLLHGLLELGPKQAVLTGVSFENDKLGAACLQRGGQVEYYFQTRIEGYYHGTGDVYGSALLGALLNGKMLPEAMAIAVDFTCGCIERTRQAKTDVRFGVDFERGLPQLQNRIGLA